MNEIDDINLLELYIESGIDESYHDKPYNFYQDNNKNISQIFDENFKKEKHVISINEINEIANETASKVKDFNTLIEVIKNFQHCPLKDKSISTIYGKGNSINPDLFVITEIPNNQEDKTGTPFVGDTGELLIRILSAINCSLDTNTYATPSMFYRPAGGRIPTMEEMQTIKPFIYKMIELLKPKVILLFGSLPSSLILNNNDSITSIRGKWYDFKGIPVLPTFSLQYTLNTSKQGIREVKQKVWEDVQEVKKKLTN